MDSEHHNNGDKKRSRPVPLIVWFAGALLTGGLVTFAFLSFKKGEIITDLTFRLTETETNLTREKDELSDKLGKSNENYVVLQTQHEAAIASLVAAETRNKRLASSNASYILREDQLKQELIFWQDSTGKLNSALEALLSETGLLRNTIQELQAQLDRHEQEISGQASMIMSQMDRMTADSMALAALQDSVKKENVAGFFNNTNLTGAYGLKERSTPYSQYYYGLQTVNGYVINKHFMTGIGIGIQAYNGGGLMAPLFVDLRYTLGRKKFTPYLFADGGILMNFDDIEVPSLFVNPGLGFMQSLGGHFALNMGAGFYMQKDVSRHSFVNVNMGIVYRKK